MEARRKPEDFLELLEQSKKGRLKIYIGSVAGVGKTFRMLQEAHTLVARGVDIKLAYIETHNRPDTHALVAGLPIIPRKSYDYRGVTIEEMDLDEVLRQKPQVVIVDELAHTNLPLCKNRKRYQDVIDILQAGINVICAFNVQHLESLNDIVKQVTGITVHETIPDHFLKNADQVVNLDLSVEDLIDRLSSGKIYAQEKIEWALGHFFKEENLARLRELALREVAETLDRARPMDTKSAQKDLGAEPSMAGGRLMVCLRTADHSQKPILRKASRLVGRLNTDWFVVYVETPKDAPERIDAEKLRRLYADLHFATELGAQIVHLKAKDQVSAWVQFASENRVSHMAIDRGHYSLWRVITGRGITRRLLDMSTGQDVYILNLRLEKEDHS